MSWKNRVAGATLLGALGVAGIYIHHLNVRLQMATHPLFHRHADVRQFMIRAALDGLQSPIVVLGDSITEMARLPESACGHPIVNAGVGGAATSDFLTLAPVLLDDLPRPQIIVVALGANDIGSSAVTHDYSELLARLSAFTPNITAISDTSDHGVVMQQRTASAAAGVPFHDVTVTGLMSDGIHFTRAGYAQWLPVLNEAIAAACTSARASQ